MLLKKRDRWRALALSMFSGDVRKLPLPLQKFACSMKGPGSYIYIPECFGDVLCETAQAIRQLVGKSTTPLRSPKPGEWQLAGVSRKCMRRKRPA